MTDRMEFILKELQAHYEAEAERERVRGRSGVSFDAKAEAIEEALKQLRE